MAVVASSDARSDELAGHPPALWHGRLTVAVQWLLLFFAATLPLYYDLSVPEVSGDIRWMATNFFAGLVILLLLARAALAPQAVLNWRWPPIFWFALGLSIWAAVSLVDALNWLRGIILIKAMYSQMLLMVAVYCVANPLFIRRLMWALILPMGFTSFLGIAQFHGWNGASFTEALQHSWLFFWLQPLFWLLGHVLYLPAQFIPGWPATANFIDQIAGYFQQSAIPGSTFANKNLAGSWTAMMLPIALYLLITAKRWPTQAFASIWLALAGLFFVYARARASWLALFASLCMMAVLVILLPKVRRSITSHFNPVHVFWLIVPLLVVARWGGDTSPISGAHAIDRTPAEQVQALTNSSWNEIGGRLAYNLNSIAITRDYWFNGVGLGSFYVVYPAYYATFVVTPQNSYSVQARPQRTHSDFTQAFDEMGILGGIFFAGWLLSGIAMAFRLLGQPAARMASSLAIAGSLGGVLLLMVFVEYKGMLSIPNPYNLLTQAGFVLAIAALLWRAWRNYRLTQHDKTSAIDDNQLIGLMAGISVLTISINATLDFPMQLPTAPAATALLLGAIAAIFMQYQPQGAVVLPKRVEGLLQRFRLPRVGVFMVMVIVAGAWVAALADAVAFRTGNQYLKYAMMRIYAGVYDEETMAIMNKAMQAYPYDPRIHEHMGVVYANYNGAQPLPLEDRIAKLEWVVSGDYWGANHIINLSSQYLVLADSMVREGKVAEARKLLVRVEELYARLQLAANFSHYTWGVGGLLRLMQGNPQEAIALFNRSLAIEPGYEPAKAGLTEARKYVGDVKPIVVRNGFLGN
ncbi:MAG: hypothetical protein EBQ80_05650 [Proteobacteria bacterium]|nr:hypothetical protein [Pseudomonadota bacterium]